MTLKVVVMTAAYNDNYSHTIQQPVCGFIKLIVLNLAIHCTCGEMTGDYNDLT